MANEKQTSQAPSATGVKLKFSQIMERLRTDGGHLYIGEYRGSAAEAKEFVEEEDRGGKKKGDVTKYIGLKHSVEIRQRGLPKMEIFNERVDGVDPSDESVERVIKSIQAKRGDTVMIWNPSSFTNKKTGVTTMSCKGGLIVVDLA